jgi:hypothetical protein
MKHLKLYITFLLLGGLGIFSCHLEEDPNFLSSTNLFDDVAGANIALNGVYSSLADFGYYNSEWHHALNWTSGMYNTNRASSLKDIAALNPSTNSKHIDNLWGGIYRTISRANNMILQLEDKDLGNPEERDKILGQVYFIRSLAYFDIARIWGKGPLITTYLESDNTNIGLSTFDALFEQVFSDGDRAIGLMADTGENEPGRPTKYAAHMLMAKAHMWLAGNQDAGNTDHWQLAYDHASQVYGQYQLVSHFADLWNSATRNNSIESIFELQANVENSNWLLKYWSASNANIGRSTWGRFKPNLEVYDRHVETYPGDPRVTYTFRTVYNSYAADGSINVQETYPSFTERGNRDKSYPFGNKYFIQDESMTNTDNDWNYVVFRYGEVLLMLAEIENELNGPDNAYVYVNQVLERARNSADTIANYPEDWSGMSQSEFRDAITREYIFELQQEGKDFFHLRRRGWEFFRDFVILTHNTHPVYDFNNDRDLEYPDNERIMLLPIPDTEINTNTEINASDQNSGY